MHRGFRMVSGPGKWGVRQAGVRQAGVRDPPG